MTNTHLLTTLKIDATAAVASGSSDNVACDELGADWPGTGVGRTTKSAETAEYLLSPGGRSADELQQVEEPRAERLPRPSSVFSCYLRRRRGRCSH